MTIPNLDDPPELHPLLARRRGRPKIQLRRMSITAEELTNWLHTLRIAHKHFARMLRVSRSAVQNWTGGDLRVPGYVAAWLEMYTLWETAVREHVTMNQTKELVYEFLAGQSRAVAAEVVADRLRLPVGVVLETMERLREEGSLDAEGVQ